MARSAGSRGKPLPGLSGAFRKRSIYVEAQDALADFLGPQQVLVGVSGGLSILVHGLRELLFERRDFGRKGIDIRNAYNENDRAVVLRRLAAVPELAHLAPLFHALHAPAAPLRLSSTRALFEAGERQSGDSETGVRQGSAEASATFCVGIAPELAELDRELSEVGGLARAAMDDIYAVGPAYLVFEAVGRFAAALEREVGLVLRVEKLTCFSHGVDLAHCLLLTIWSKTGVPRGASLVGRPSEKVGVPGVSWPIPTNTALWGAPRSGPGGCGASAALPGL